MSEWLKSLFVSIFGTNSALATLIISMIPIVELRGAIPFGSASAFWGDNALKLWQSFLISLAGSSFICIILTFAFWPLFNWLKGTKAFHKIADMVEKKLGKKSKNISQKTENEIDEKKILRLKLFGAFIFVALPLPLTGVWTGTCLALFIGLSKKQTLTTVLSGNLVAGLIMTLISFFFADNTVYVLYAFIILVVLFVIFEIIKSLIVKIKNKRKVDDDTKTSNLNNDESVNV